MDKIWGPEESVHGYIDCADELIIKCEVGHKDYQFIRCHNVLKYH